VFKTLLTLALIFSSASLAQGEPDHIMLRPDQLNWGPATPALPAGAQAAVLFGDPGAAGPFSIRVKFPANYYLPPHYHPQDENVTVISGTLLMGMGEDPNSPMSELPEGSFFRMKSGTRHFARAKTDTIIQINDIGPWGIVYINPEDDPRNQK